MEDDPIDHREKVVFAKGDLVDNDTEEIITSSTMCASTKENWLQGKALSAAYGLAQTRLEERLIRTRFGYQLSLVRLQPTGAEELDVNIEQYGTKNKEI